MARFEPFDIKSGRTVIARVIPGSSKKSPCVMTARIEFGPFTRAGRFWRWLTAPLRRWGLLRPSMWDRVRESARNGGGVSFGYPASGFLP